MGAPCTGVGTGTLYGASTWAGVGTSTVLTTFLMTSYGTLYGFSTGTGSLTMKGSLLTRVIGAF